MITTVSSWFRCSPFWCPGCCTLPPPRGFSGSRFQGSPGNFCSQICSHLRCVKCIYLMMAFLALIFIFGRYCSFDFDVHLSCAFLQGLSFLMYENRNHDVNFFVRLWEIPSCFWFCLFQLFVRHWEIPSCFWFCLFQLFVRLWEIPRCFCFCLCGIFTNRFKFLSIRIKYQSVWLMAK